MYYDDSSSGEEEDEDDDFELLVAGIIREEDFRRSMLGSQIGRIRIHRDRVNGHDHPRGITLRRLQHIQRSVFSGDSRCTGISSTPLQELWRTMILGSN